MPGEEGYPAYLAARLSEFYERAGRVVTLQGKNGSVSVIGAVSPPGGDFSEPVTQNTLRIVKVFWALDAKLSQRRHFPSINWLNSYSLYLDSLQAWYDREVSPEWNKVRAWSMEILQKESELQEIVQLVGSDALPEEQQITIEVARMVREVFLQQNAYDPVDTYCDMGKQFDMMTAIRKYSEYAYAAQAAGVLLPQTCNRVEVISHVQKSVDGREALENFLAETRQVPRDLLQDRLYSFQGKPAVRHLFRLASSLDSMVLGEPQILGQVKSSYGTALDASTVGPYMNPLLQAGAMTTRSTSSPQFRRRSGSGGAEVSGYNIAPWCAIAVDVTHAISPRGQGHKGRATSDLAGGRLSPWGRTSRRTSGIR
jgi:hypothetical protein